VNKLAKASQSSGTQNRFHISAVCPIPSTTHKQLRIMPTEQMNTLHLFADPHFTYDLVKVH